MTREATLAAAAAAVLALLIALAVILWRYGFALWKAKTKRANNLAILADIEMEFATEDDDELL